MWRSVVCAGFGACHAENGGVRGAVPSHIGCLEGGVAYLGCPPVWLVVLSVMCWFIRRIGEGVCRVIRSAYVTVMCPLPFVLLEERGGGGEVECSHSGRG